MSDIGLRLDGLILVGAIILSGIVYAIVTGAALLAAWILGARRSSALRIAGRGAALTLVCAVVGMIAGAYLDRTSTPIAGPDVVDWLTVPWLLLFIGGCISLVRARRDTTVNHPSP